MNLIFERYKNQANEIIVTLVRDSNTLMTAKMMSKLYGVDISTIRKQLQSIFDNKVLDKKLVSEIIAHRASDGKLYETRYYNEDIIVELGLRLRSEGARSFRNWLKSKGSYPRLVAKSGMMQPKP